MKGEMMKIEKHLELLGRTATDKVTKFKGVISTLSFDLYGCIQVVLKPEIDKDGKDIDGRWFDVSRLKLSTKKPVMPMPDFDSCYLIDGTKGPALKPIK